MVFRICKQNEQILYQRNIVKLQYMDREESGFRVTFSATFYDRMGRAYCLGKLRIGMMGLESGAVRDYLPTEFSKLPNHFFSLGCDEFYYEKINDLRVDDRRILLDSLRDIAFKREILEVCQHETVFQTVILGSIHADKKAAIAKIKGQLHRMAHGSARLTKFSFTYVARQVDDPLVKPTKLHFNVEPESNPPTNVHALIGRNGSGKTHLIRQLVQCLQDNSGEYGTIEFRNADQHVGFVNVLCVAFSPFDDFSRLIHKDGDIPATFVGLNKRSRNLSLSIWKEFWKHFQNCLIAERKKRLWQEAIEELKSDFTFKREGIDTFMDDLDSYPEQTIKPKQIRRIREIFDQLSSGHKLVLLLITSCVAEIEERSVLILDEPETHLHPPLLAALIRALSNLLRDCNGVAIISTHSAVVLQEIPRNCVWMLTRTGQMSVTAERPELETFGSSLGALIDNAFGLEVEYSGFHKMMAEAAAQYDSFDEVMKLYKGRVGNEAGILLRMMMYRKQRKGQ